MEQEPSTSLGARRLLPLSIEAPPPSRSITGSSSAGLGRLPTTPSAAYDHLLSYERATIWLHYARYAEEYVPEDCFQTAMQVRLFKWRRRCLPLIRGVFFVYLVAAFVEWPSWCLERECGPPSNVLRSDLPLWPPWVTRLIELGCLLCILAYYILAGKTLRFFPWTWCLLVLTALSLLDVSTACFNTIGIVPTTFRLSRLLRPLIFCLGSLTMRTTVMRIAQTVPNTIQVFGIIFLSVLVFGWVGVIFFSGTGGHAEFPTFKYSVKSLFVSLTTANFPQVMLSAYADNRAAPIFFVLFTFLVMTLLMNVLLAAIYNSYKEVLREWVLQFYLNRNRALQAAFDLLKNKDGVVTMDEWCAFFSHWSGGDREGGGGGVMHVKRGRRLFRCLDTDHNGDLTEDEFMLLIRVMTEKDVVVLRYPPESKARIRRLVAICLSRRFDILIDVLITISVIITCTQTMMFVEASTALHQHTTTGEGQPPDHHPVACFYSSAALYYLQLALSATYAAELAFKISVLGFERFWKIHPLRNRFDLYAVIPLVLAEALFLIEGRGGVGHVFVERGEGAAGWCMSGLGRFLAFLRMQRGIRLLFNFERLQTFATELASVLTSFNTIAGLLIVVFYVYATVGIQLFGGRMTLDKVANRIMGAVNTVTDANVTVTMPLSVEVNGTSSASLPPLLEHATLEALLNFNDFYSSLITLIVLMINGWHDTLEIYLEETSEWCGLFFASFYILCVLIVLNCFMALILEAFDHVSEGPSSDPTRHRIASAPGVAREEVLRKMFADELDWLDKSSSFYISTSSGISASRIMRQPTGGALASVRGPSPFSPAITPPQSPVKLPPTHAAQQQGQTPGSKSQRERSGESSPPHAFLFRGSSTDDEADSPFARSRWDSNHHHEARIDVEVPQLPPAPAPPQPLGDEFARVGGGGGGDDGQREEETRMDHQHLFGPP